MTENLTPELSNSQPTFPAPPHTLQSIYNFRTIGDLWYRLRTLRPSEIQGMIPTGEFRPPMKLEKYISPSLFVMTADSDNDTGNYPHLIIRELKKVTKYRLAPGEQPRLLKIGDIVAATSIEKQICFYVKTNKENQYGWVLEAYEEYE